MKRLLAFTGGLCILGSFFAASASPVQKNAAAFEAVAMTTTSATTVTTTENLNKYEINVGVFDLDKQDEPIHDSAIVRLEKRFIDENNNVLKTEVIDTWDIAESNPHKLTVPGDPQKDGFIVAAVMDAFPHGYSELGNKTLSGEKKWVWNGLYYSGGPFRLHKNPYIDAEFPIEGKFSATVDVVKWEMPGSSREMLPYPGLEAALIDMKTGKELLTWNTTEQPQITLTDLDYRFEDWKMENVCQYGVIIKNLPEGCRLNTSDPLIIEYNLTELEQNEQDVRRSVEIVTPGAVDTYYSTTTTTTTTTTQTTTTTTVSNSANNTEQSTTTTTTSTTAPTTSTTTTTTTKAPLSDETLCKWAAKDYSDKNQTSVSAEISGRENGKVSITLKDEAGKAVDTYVIDETSGIGENAAGDAVNLPQTGNNAPADYLIAVGALLLTIAGAWALYATHKRSQMNK